MQYRVIGGSLNDRLSGFGLLRSLLDYTLRSKGPLTHSAHEVGGFVKTRPDLARPDAQIGVGLYSMSVSGKTVNIDPRRAFRSGATSCGRKAGASCISSRPTPPLRPYINANQLTADIDVKSAISLFRWIRRLAAQPALAPWLVSEITPGPGFETDAQIIDAFLRFGSTAYPRVRHSAHGRATPTPRSIRNCDCAASRTCAWPTPPSCRHSCPAIPMHRPW